MTRNLLPRRAAVRAALSVLTFAAADSLHAQQAFDPARPEIAAFITDVASRHEMEPAELAGILAQAQSQPAILQAISKPAERALTWRNSARRGRL